MNILEEIATLECIHCKLCTEYLETFSAEIMKKITEIEQVMMAKTKIYADELNNTRYMS